MAIDDIRWYNNLPQCTETQPSLPLEAASALTSLLSVLRHYELENDVGFAVLHRNFELAAHEVVSWSATDNGMISKIEQLSSVQHMPILWQVLENGRLVSLEFVDLTTLTKDESQRLLHWVRGEKLHAIAKALRFVGAHRTFAISFLPSIMRDRLAQKGGAMERGFLNEETDHKSRSSTLTFSSF
jgi:hypothetical protein